MVNSGDCSDAPVAVAALESIFTIVEFVLGMACLQQGLTALVGGSLFPSLMATLVIIAWLSYRAVGSWEISWTDLAIGIHMTRFKLSPTAVALIAAHLLSLLLVYLLQDWLVGRTLLTTDNYTDEYGAFDIGRAATMLVLSPFREEFVFRGIIFATFYRRTSDLKHVVFAPAFFFGAIHLFNLNSPRYSIEFVALQTALAAVIGSFYAMRAIISGSLYEPMVLHAINNFCGSFMPIDDRFDLSNTLISLPREFKRSHAFVNVLTKRPVAQTLLLYAALASFSWKRISIDHHRVDMVISTLPKIWTHQPLDKKNGRKRH